MVFQNYALYPHMTSAREHGLPAKDAAAPERRDQPTAWTRRRGCSSSSELLDRKPADMSGGQRQRVAMGRAIVRQPDVFLFDEPLSNLDAKLRVQMRIEIARLQKRYGTTTIYVTHDQVEAMTLADRVAVMRKGVVQQVGLAPRAVQQPGRTCFVAGFIGSPAMNFMPGELHGERARPRRGASVRAAVDRAAAPAGRRTADEGDRGRPSGGLRGRHARRRRRRSGVDVPRRRIDVVEWMGSELYVYFQPGPRHDSLSLERGRTRTGHERGLPPTRAESVTARLDPASLIEQGDERRAVDRRPPHPPVRPRHRRQPAVPDQAASPR